jgi:hypothetical protein
MDKLNLNLDDLAVDSFATDETESGRGTVNGQTINFTDDDPSCNNQTCFDTCNTCDGYTCYRSCDGGCTNYCGTYDETACSPCSPTNIYEPCEAY